MAELMSAIVKVEPKNAKLLHYASKICSRLANKHPQVLSDSIRMIEAAIEIEPRSTLINPNKPL